ncbi:MAG TPA: phage tail sheath C-terminal domain-containing protein [Microlunatus sp.]
MSLMTLWPGVYVQEIPSGVRAITGVATSITAFIGRTRWGPTNEATVINGFADYERQFGGIWAESTVSFAVRDFFIQGGAQAVIVRLAKDAKAATFDVGTLGLIASSGGGWANELTVSILIPVDDDDAKLTAAGLGVGVSDLFSLEVKDAKLQPVETVRNLVVTPDDPRNVTAVLAAESRLVRVDPAKPVPGARPGAAANVAATDPGTDGTVLDTASYLGDATNPLQARHQGLWALDGTDLFNLLCIPPPTRGQDTAGDVYVRALKYCVDRRAMLIVDPPSGLTPATGAKTLMDLKLSGTDARNAALYYPRLLQSDPTANGRRKEFVPCGAVAGVMARTDTTRGVWKAPAGIDAALPGNDLAVRLTNEENGQLNPLGINCLRSFPIIGNVVWGARTLRGADLLADEYKYVPVRRLALFIEESLFRGTQWVVFEPNDEPLWAQIRLNVGAFLQELFRRGAFEGASARDAYFVKCDAETTTVNDRNLGRVNILVGFAPLRPAEFVILQIQQIARAQA